MTNPRTRAGPALAATPNLLSIARVALAFGLPAAFLALDAPAADRLALAMVLLAAASDALDGWLARRLGLESALGAALDQLADKALTLAALLTLGVFRVGPEPWFWAATLLIAGREIAVAILRARRAAAAGRPNAIPPSRAGKWKTATQFAALAALFAVGVLAPVAPAAADALRFAGTCGLWLAALLGLWSALGYLRRRRS